MAREHAPAGETPEHSPFLPASGGGGGPPTGPAGGALTGTYPNPTLATAPASAYQALTPGTKTEALAGSQAAKGRTENSGTTVRLVGAVEVKPAETVLAGATLATIPAGLRPLNNLLFDIQFNSTFTESQVEIVAATGVIKALGTWAEKSVAHFDGITYNLT